MEVESRYLGPQVAMLHIGGKIHDDGRLGEVREIPYSKPLIEVGGVRFVWMRWPGIPYGILEVFGRSEEVWPFFHRKAAELLAFGQYRVDQIVMN